MFNFIIKDVPTKFVILGDKEVKANNIFSTLEEFESENDDINGYNLYSRDAADVLVDEGVLEKHIGSRMATLYRKTAKFDKFYDTFMGEYLV